MGWDGCYRVELWGRRWLPRLMVLRTRTVQLLSFRPLHTLIACEFHREALGSENHSSNIHEDVSVDGFASKVEVFVCLDVEGSHQLYFFIKLKKVRTSAKLRLSRINKIMKQIKQ